MSNLLLSHELDGRLLIDSSLLATRSVPSRSIRNDSSCGVPSRMSALIDFGRN